MSEKKVRVLFVASDEASGTVVALRLRTDPRITATSVGGIANGAAALQAGAEQFDFVLVDGFFEPPHGYRAGSPSADFIDREVVPRGLAYGRYVSLPMGVPSEYHGSFPPEPKPLQTKRGDGTDLEDRIVAAVSMSA